ncbi:hypothetical protein LLH03_15365 [bacterium]|nr:hypothetical protein [bacterium]
MRDPRPDTKILEQLGEFFAAGYFENPAAGPMERWSRALRRRLEARTPMAYDGGLLYPCGVNRPPARVVQDRFVSFSYSFTWSFNDQALAQALTEEPDPATQETLEALRDAMVEERRRLRFLPPPHTVGGNGYTHSIPNYGRVLREGLNEHARRVAEGLEEALEREDEERIAFYRGLQDVLAGIQAWHRSVCGYLESWAPTDQAAAIRRDELAAALHQVPFSPARTFLEAVVAYNFVYYLDDCDNPGRLDQELQPFYEADRKAGRIDREKAAALIAAFADNVRTVAGWSAAIGGTTPDGAPAYNDVTLMLLEAAHGRYRPSLELRVRKDMPDEVWDAALEAVTTGSGNPAFYNEEAYLQSLHDADLGLSAEDATRWNGGGCTETMIHGCSNVGSLEAGLNLGVVLDQSLHRHLPAATSFDELLGTVKQDIATETERLVAQMNEHLAAKATWLPQPMRSLLIDDCIDRGIDFNSGGARYNWSVVNLAGMTNLIDSLAAVREVVFDQEELSGAELLSALEANFADREGLRRRLAHCAAFGNDIEAVDTLAADVAGFVYEQFRRHKQFRGGRFLPSCIMFVTYADAGARVGATPDGRRAGEPLADSIGPSRGRDTHGPTAMLRSVTHLPLHLATGTPVLNLRFSRHFLTRPEERPKVRALLETYFALGGMQVQLSVVDRAELEDALIHPELHRDLIVRIGGYSDYFVRLSPALQQTVVERTEYAL